jgi:pimeloyl-ACP methyl ester carboxylesterase
MEYKEKTFKLPNGLDIACKEIGNQNSTIKILCLHGWLDNSNSFDYLISHFDLNTVHVVQMDFSGHGKSSHKTPYSHYNLSSRVSEVYYLVKLLKWNKYMIIAHSMGGSVASIYASLYSKNITHLILLDSIGPFIRTDISARKLLMLNISSQENLMSKVPKKFNTFDEAVENSYSARKNDISKESLFYLLQRGVIKTPEGFQYSHDILCQGISQFQYHEEDVLDMYRHVKCPTLIIFCSHSRDLFQSGKYPQEYMKRTEAFPDCKLVSVEDSKHHFHLDKPIEIYSIIEEFISNSKSKL